MSNNNNNNIEDFERQDKLYSFESIENTGFVRHPYDLPSTDSLIKKARLREYCTSPEAICDFQQTLIKLYNRLYAIVLKTDDYNIKEELYGKCKFYGKVIQICQTLLEYQALVDLQVLQSEKENKNNGS